MKILNCIEFLGSLSAAESSRDRDHLTSLTLLDCFDRVIGAPGLTLYELTGNCSAVLDWFEKIYRSFGAIRGPNCSLRDRLGKAMGIG
jgi:hypothetical protein